MAEIKAKGPVMGCDFEVTVKGDGTVDKIECSGLIRAIVTDGIESGAGSMANGYHPDGGTMLQAYAFLVDMFGEEHVMVDGDIGTMPYEKGAIY